VKSNIYKAGPAKSNYQGLDPALAGLEGMNLDRGGDEDAAKDMSAFYNMQNRVGIELEAQNKYMNKKTAAKQQLWSPEEQER